ncbi:MAG: hypothetical protein ABIO70_26590, partial [Pseudomonadota bacterium]
MRPSHLFALGLLLTACHPPWDSADSGVLDTDADTDTDTDTDADTDTDTDTDDTGLPGHAPVVAFTRPAEDGAAFWEGVGAIFLLEASDPDGDLDHINIESDL